MFRQWKAWRQKILWELESGFREWLYYIKEAVKAGKSFEQAALYCKAGFYKTLPEAHCLKLLLNQFYKGLELHLPVEDGIRKIGEETGIEVIMDFAIVFEIVRKQGGRMSDTLDTTIQQISDRIGLQQEIQSMIQAKKLEQKIMCIMPFVILVFVGKFSRGYFISLYHNLQGIIIMSVCMGVYLFGVWWGEKLTEVQI